MNETSTPDHPVPLPWLGVLRAHGKDAVDYLHGQLSADLHALNDGHGTFACLCTPQGSVIALLWAGRTAAGLDLVGRRALLPSVRDQLEKFRLRAQVEFGLDDRDGVSVQLDDNRPTYRRQAGADATTPGDNALASKAAELEAGVCWLDEASSGAFLPQMLGFDALGAVNFHKGCYPGQEIIARARYLGRVKRHPWVLDTEAMPEPEPMQAVMLRTGNDEVDAVVVDHAPLPGGGLRLFCVARAAPGAKLDSLELEGERYALSRAAPPLPPQGSPST